VKDWQKSYFYCPAQEIPGEHPLPGFRESRLEFHGVFNLFPKEVHQKRNELILARIRALLAHGITARDLTKCWVGWQIQPLSIRDRLMCEYTGKDDPMGFAHNELSASELVTACKKFLAECLDYLKKVGLAPFCKDNPAPVVCFFHIFS
jgi:hypothetical protein